MSYNYADPTTGNRITVTDDGRVILTDNSFGQLLVGLTSVAASGVITSLQATFPDVPGLPDDADTPPEAVSQDTSGA